MPAEAAYRVNTEALVKSRLALVDKVNMNHRLNNNKLIIKFIIIKLKVYYY